MRYLRESDTRVALGFVASGLILIYALLLGLVTGLFGYMFLSMSGSDGAPGWFGVAGLGGWAGAVAVLVAAFGRGIRAEIRGLLLVVGGLAAGSVDGLLVAGFSSGNPISNFQGVAWGIVILGGAAIIRGIRLLTKTRSRKGYRRNRIVFVDTRLGLTI